MIYRESLHESMKTSYQQSRDVKSETKVGEIAEWKVMVLLMLE